MSMCCETLQAKTMMTTITLDHLSTLKQKLNFTFDY